MALPDGGASVWLSDCPDLKLLKKTDSGK